MKLKISIAISIATVLLLILATSVFAKPITYSGTLTASGGETGSGQYSISFTHNGAAKITVSLKGATPTGLGGDSVELLLASTGGSLQIVPLGELQVKNGGSGRLSYKTQIGTGTYTATIVVSSLNVPGGKFESSSFTLAVPTVP